jgi:hypothetical protein
MDITLPASPRLPRGSAKTNEFASMVLADSEVISLLTQGENHESQNQSSRRFRWCRWAKTQ